MIQLTESESQALRDVAERLYVPKEWLAAVINFETAGTWDPKVKNPHSSARGLIQFLDTTAKDLGYMSALDLVTKNPTIESQLRGPVLKYLLKQGPRFRNKQALWFSIFLPRYKNAALTEVIYADNPEKQARFRAANPGVITVGDYYHKLEKAFEKGKVNLISVVAFAVLGITVVRLIVKGI